MKYSRFGKPARAQNLAHDRRPGSLCDEQAAPLARSFALAISWMETVDVRLPITLSAKGEFLAVSKGALRTIENNHVWKTITDMQGTDIGVYKLKP